MLTFHRIVGRIVKADTLTAAHLPRLAPGVKHLHSATGRSYERLFARKFDDSSGEILDRIDAEFRRT